jgi:hypothetical protein
MRWEGRGRIVAFMGDIRNACKIPVRKREWKRALGKSMRI